MFSNRKKIKIQGKTTSHKHAMVKSQMIELLRNQKIKTTPRKAKLLKSKFDRVVTMYKKGTDASKRNVWKALGQNDRALERLEVIVKDKLSDRTSGYTRVIKTLARKGDNADQVYVMLVNAEAQDSKTKAQKLLEKQEANKGKRKKKK